MKGFFIFCLIMSAFLCCFNQIYAEVPKVKVDNQNYLELSADFYLPDIKPDVKVPVVFMGHNGGSNKEGWGDFPKQLAEQGWLVVNYNWNSLMFRTNLEVESAVQFAYKKYANLADPERAAFIGGCRGGANMIAELTRVKKLPCKVKTMVVLGVTEGSTYTDMMSGLQTEHFPILAYYSLKDRFGLNYQNITKQFVTELLTEPKTVVALDATPHGHELATDPATKDQVRKEIIEWLKKYFI